MAQGCCHLLVLGDSYAYNSQIFRHLTHHVNIYVYRLYMCMPVSNSNSCSPALANATLSGVTRWVSLQDLQKKGVSHPKLSNEVAMNITSFSSFWRSLLLQYFICVYMYIFDILCLMFVYMSYFWSKNMYEYIHMTSFLSTQWNRWRRHRSEAIASSTSHDRRGPIRWGHGQICGGFFCFRIRSSKFFNFELT